jgi:hypothetical protein
MSGKMKGKLREIHTLRSLKYATCGLISVTLSILAIFSDVKKPVLVDMNTYDKLY